MRILEVIKEVGRVSVLAIISYLLTGVVLNTVVVAVVGDRLTPEMVVIITGGLTAVLRGVEKELHNQGSKYQLPIK